MMYPQVSAKDDRVIFVPITASLGVLSVPFASTAGASRAPLPGTAIDGKSFTNTAWSPDGARLAGCLRADNGKGTGIGVYDLAAQTTTVVAADETPGRAGGWPTAAG